MFTVSVVMNIKKIFKEEESIKTLKILGSIKYIIMPEANMNQKLRLKISRWNKKWFNWRNKS